MLFILCALISNFLANYGSIILTLYHIATIHTKLTYSCMTLSCCTIPSSSRFLNCEQNIIIYELICCAYMPCNSHCVVNYFV